MSVLTRLCIDRLRVAKAERTIYPGPWLPEPLVGNFFPSPEEQAELASDLSMAFLLLLERLAPDERAAFLLYDVFDCDYREIAHMLGKSEVSCRQIVHRARARVRNERRRFDANEGDRIRLIEKFAAAIQAGDQDVLLSLFAADSTFTSDGGGKAAAARNIIRGPDRITRLLLGVARKALNRTIVIAPINGQPGLIVLLGGKVHSALSFETDGQRILALYNVLNPEKLKTIALQRTQIQ
jgi:RNA polymerase sigma-70 factor (ECF subfamily)